MTRCIDGTGHRCDRLGTVRLVAPDGWTGQPMCREHAQDCIDEYREKLGEEWGIVEIEEAP